jgi:hypothetical protein
MAKAPKPGQTRFKVDVTQEDIDKAHRNNSYKCIVAQAVARTIPDATRIEIDLQTVRFTRAATGERLLFLTPNIAAGYVVAFDAGDEMHPFSFNLSNPVKVTRRVRTEAGLASDRAAKKAKRADVARSPERATSGMPGADPQAIAEAVKEEFAAAQKTRTVSGDHPPRPRTYKTGKRGYGSRILRVNRYLREEEAAAG